MEYLDFRSDTVTKPTEEMRDAARSAVVGDDVWGDDPTVQELEAYAAELLGKEEAMFVTSGTMGNIVSVLSQTVPGDEVFLEADAHIYHYEVGGISALAGAIPHLIRTEYGNVTSEQLTQEIRSENIHFPHPSLLCLENTHSRHGGTALSVSEVASPAKTAHDYGMKVHLDGARLFNASLYNNVDAKEYTKHVDTVQICLSKGLSAPIGSIVASDKETMKIARKKRKMLGGGMRQVGIIAAPGLIALRDMRDRLIEDHCNAKKLGDELKSLGYEVIEPQTNILVVSTRGKFASTEEAVKIYEGLGIGVAAFGINRVRFTTHRHIDKQIVSEAINRISQLEK